MRFVRDQKLQFLLMLSGVGVGVGVIVFISALIGGLQQTLIERTLGTQPHVVIEPREEVARALIDDEPGVLRLTQQPEQRVRSIAEWQKVRQVVETVPGIESVAAVATGPGFARRGNATRPVVIYGIDATEFGKVIPLSQGVTAGQLRLDSGNVVLGTELASQLGLSVGDKLRLQTAEGAEQLLSVAGLLDLGNQTINERWALVSLRSAQTLLAMPGGVSALYADVTHTYDAALIADRIRGMTGLKLSDWMSKNEQLLTALRSQTASTTMIRFFVMISVAIGIASVLVVSVVQRSGEIGILRAMGVSAKTVSRIFLLQGAMIGAGGWLFGSALGFALLTGFSRVAINADGSPLFPVVLTAQLFWSAGLLSTVVGALAALVPARRASRLDPAVAIRNG